MMNSFDVITTAIIIAAVEAGIAVASGKTKFTGADAVKKALVN